VPVQGEFGWASYAVFARGGRTDAKGKVLSQVFCLGGLLENAGYVIQLDAKPALPEAESAIVRGFLTRGVTYEGEQRDPKWTEVEASERWNDSVPDPKKMELEDTLRTAHYIILTNSSGGKSFAKKMEECYAAVKKVYPFEEVPGQRLMPVFLFQTADEYYRFFAKSFGMTVEDGERTGGVASGDFYSTWYEAPGDPVHVHEATHQIFRNRLGLGGGGSWFQEGVAEYMSTKDNERGSAARAVKKGRHVALAQFVKVRSLIFSSPKENKSGEDDAANQYEQAALIVEFMRESKFGKDKFQAWVHAIGSAPRNDLPAIEAATKRSCGTDLAGFERELIEYCKKR